MANSSLATITVKALSSNYGAGRTKIDHITIHHMAGILTAVRCGQEWQKYGKRVSSHYGIGSDGVIASYVDEKNIAWADGNKDSNATGVSIEVSNSARGGDWPVSDKSLNLLIKLVADIAKRNGLGTLKVGKNLFGHRDKCATTCPGNYLYSRLGYIAAEANKINTTPATATAKGFLPARGYWTYGDKDDRIAQMATFMRKTFPSYVTVAALGSYFGPNLKKAVMEFQRRAKKDGKYNGCGDGGVGSGTYAALQAYGFRYKK